MKALITLAVLGSSSVALASPTLSVRGNASVTVVRDHTGYQLPVADDCNTHQRAPVIVKPVSWPGYYANPNNTRIGADSSTYIGAINTLPGPVFIRGRGWIRAASFADLTEATRIDSGREFFNLKGMQLQKLQLQGLGGSTAIRQVAVEFTDGSTQKVRYDRAISRGGTLTIDLDGSVRNVKRVIVYGDSSRGSAFKLLAV
jgi:hypothetical protein